MVTEVSHQSVRCSSVLICCFVISWFVQFFSPKITGHLSPWSIIRTGGDFGQEIAALFWADDSAPTFISSGHNLSLQAQLSFQLKNKFFLSIKGQDQVHSCELQEYKYFLAIGLLLSGMSSQPKLWRLLFLTAISPTPFGLPEIHPCGKSTCISCSPNLCPVVII